MSLTVQNAHALQWDHTVGPRLSDRYGTSSFLDSQNAL